MALAVLLPALFVSCTKSGVLTGSGAGSSSSFGTITGSANGGLSPLSGASVNLYLGGNSTPVASATTAADGSFSIVFNGQTSGNFLYLTITGGNAGSGTNSNNQLMSIVGTSGVPLSSLKVNEMSTAATELVGMNMGLLNDSNGTITLNAPKNAPAANNVVTQFGNLIANGNLNASNSNLTTSAQNGLKVMANAFASCIENSSNCGKLFSTATNSSGTNALTVLESGYYALLNNSNVASSLYTLAFPFNSTTGFNLTSASMPGGFSFNNGLAPSVNIITVGSEPDGFAVDATGNVWSVNFGGNTITELNASSGVIGTFSCGSSPEEPAIDASGDIWVPNFIASGTVTELNSSGTTIGTFQVGNPAQNKPVSIGIDISGNIWVVNFVGGTVTKLSASGSTLGTFTVGSHPQGIAIDHLGNVWIANDGSNTITELSSSGGTLASISGFNQPNGIAFDSSGNLWETEYGGTSVKKVSSSGSILGTFSVASQPFDVIIDSPGNAWVISQSNVLTELSPTGTALATYNQGFTGPQVLAIDQSGNMWVGNWGGTTVTELPGISMGPQFFPYSGPVFPDNY